MPQNFIPPDGGYEDLLSFRKARIVYMTLPFSFASAFARNATRHVTKWCKQLVLVNRTLLKEARRPEHPRKLKSS
jgi:hypothetical protein